MADVIRVVEPCLRSPGMTEITRNGRSFQICSVQPELVRVLLEYIDKRLAAEGNDG